MEPCQPYFPRLNPTSLGCPASPPYHLGTGDRLLPAPHPPSPPLLRPRKNIRIPIPVRGAPQFASRAALPSSSPASGCCLVSEPSPHSACSSMEPSSKKRKLAPKVNASPAAPKPQPSQYPHETVSLLLPTLSLLSCLPTHIGLCSHSSRRRRRNRNRNRSRNRSTTPSTMRPPSPSAMTSSPLPATSRMRPCSSSARPNSRPTETSPPCC